MLHYGRPTAIVTTRLSTKSLGAGRPPQDSVQKGTVLHPSGHGRVFKPLRGSAPGSWVTPNPAGPDTERVVAGW